MSAKPVPIAKPAIPASTGSPTRRVRIRKTINTAFRDSSIHGDR